MQRVHSVVAAGNISSVADEGNTLFQLAKCTDAEEPQETQWKIYLHGLLVHMAQTKLYPAGKTPQVLAVRSMAGNLLCIYEVIPSKSL